jgi:hypothetical protein
VGFINDARHRVRILKPHRVFQEHRAISLDPTREHHGFGRRQAAVKFNTESISSPATSRIYRTLSMAETAALIACP